MKKIAKLNYLILLITLVLNNRTHSFAQGCAHPRIDSLDAVTQPYFGNNQVKIN